VAKYEEYARTIAYRFYIADSLKLIPQHGSLQKHLREIYYDKHVVDTRSGDEIAADVMARAGLSFRR
jgi:hypothetical protein